MIYFYRNWRIALLAFMACVAALLITSRGILPEAMGTALAVAAYLLGCRWERKGYLKELDDLKE